MTDVGLQLILGADVSTAEQALDKFYSSVQSLSKNVQTLLTDMGGSVSNIAGFFKPISDGAMNATKTAINASKARVQQDNEETQSALNASKVRLAAMAEETSVIRQIAAESATAAAEQVNASKASIAATNEKIASSKAAQAATQEELAALRLKTAQEKADQAAMRGQKDLYGTMVAKANELVREYYNAAAAIAKYGAASGITKERLEELRVAALSSQDQLKSIEFGAGRFQRNVGNYSGATAFLSQSIAQLSGEIPNFFQSMRIGFMSIGNNIQPISMAISQLRNENAQLMAQGKAQIPIMSTVIKSFLGWQTILLIGVGVISRYGGAIVDWLTGADQAKAKAEQLKKAQQELNSVQESAAKSTGENITKINLLQSTMTDASLPLKKRYQAYDEFAKLYPSYLNNVKRDQALTGALAETIDKDLIPALIRMSQAQAGQELLKNLNAQLLVTLNKIKDIKTKSKEALNSKDLYTDKNVYKTYIAGREDIPTSEVSQLKRDFNDINKQAFTTVDSIREIMKTAPKLTIDGKDYVTVGDKVKNAKVKIDDITKANEEFTHSIDVTANKLEAGYITQLQALQEKADAVKKRIESLFDAGVKGSDLKEFIDALHQINYELNAMKSVDLSNLKGVDAKKEFEGYIEGLKDLKKYRNELSSKLYNQIGVQDPRDAINRRDIYNQFDALGIDATKYIDPSKSVKEQAKQGEDALKGLQKEFTRFASVTGRLMGRTMDPLIDAIFNGKSAMDALGDSVKNLLGDLIKAVAKAALLSVLGKKDDVASAGGFGGILGGLLGIGLKAAIPFAADGGIVTGPTLAMIGESGPEKITPLTKSAQYEGGVANVRVSGRLRGKDIDLSGNNYNNWKDY